MLLTTPKTIRRRRERRRASGPTRPADARPRPARTVAQARARRGGGPEDRAFYTCECGFAWTGEVSASPSCPHCATPQAW